MYTSLVLAENGQDENHPVWVAINAGLKGIENTAATAVEVLGMHVTRTTDGVVCQFSNRLLDLPSAVEGLEISFVQLRTTGIHIISEGVYRRGGGTVAVVEKSLSTPPHGNPYSKTQITVRATDLRRANRMYNDLMSGKLKR